MSEEELIKVIKCWSSNTNQLVITIPAEVRRRLSLVNGRKFLVKIDDKKRIVLEPIETPKLPKMNNQEKR